MEEFTGRLACLRTREGDRRKLVTYIIIILQLKGVLKAEQPTSHTHTTQNLPFGEPHFSHIFHSFPPFKIVRP